jgi:hypothetical protein
MGKCLDDRNPASVPPRLELSALLLAARESPTKTDEYSGESMADRE